jgi:hypothetical protein
MRTAPVALAYLDDEAALVQAARSVSELTHYDPEAGDACVLWCLALRHAILTGELDVRIGLQHIGADRRDLWASRLDVAEASRPSDFTNNGWVVEALQGAWSAITTTPVPQDDPAKGVFRVGHLRLALDAEVRGGGVSFETTVQRLQQLFLSSTRLRGTGDTWALALRCRPARPVHMKSFSSTLARSCPSMATPSRKGSEI